MYHIMCRNLESQPYSVLPKLTSNEHGIVSEYKPLISKPKEPLEATCIKHRCPKPVDQTIFEALFIPDPQLNLTPEKTLNNQIKRTTGEITVKSKSKVKFSIPNSDSESDISATNNDLINSIPKQDSLSKQSMTSTACSSSHPSNLLSSCASRWKSISEQVQPFDKNNGPFNSYALVKPEFNSTLRIARDILRVHSAELDVNMAVKEKLEHIEAFKERVGEKAAENVNIKGNHFHNIFPIEFPVDMVIDREEEEKQELVKEAHRTIKLKKKDPEPDLFEIFPDDLQQEFLNMNASVSRPTIKPETAPLESAFDIYRYLHL